MLFIMKTSWWLALFTNYLPFLSDEYRISQTFKNILGRQVEKRNDDDEEERRK